MKLLKNNKDIELGRFNITLIAVLTLALASELTSLNTTLLADQIMLDELINCTNQIRTSEVENPLYLNYELNKAAYKKLEDMNQYDYWAHFNPVTGAKPWDFIDSTDYYYQKAGENLAIGFYNSQNVCEAWQGSPTHLANIINPDFQEVGFAVDQVDLGKEGMGILVVQMFGSRQDFKPPEGIQTVYNLRCDPEIIAGSTIVRPECRPTDDNSGTVAIAGINNTAFAVTIDNQSIENRIEAAGDNFVVRSEQPLEDGRHQVVAQPLDDDSEDNDRRGVVDFIVDTAIPEITPEQVEISFLQTSGSDNNYQISARPPHYQAKYYQQITANVTDPKTGTLLVNQKQLQRVSDNQYIANIAVNKDSAGADQLNLEIQFQDAVGNETTINKTLPEPGQGQVLRAFAQYPLAMINIFRFGISVLALLLPIPALLYLYGSRREREEFAKIPYLDYCFIVLFLGAISLIAYFF